jgi:hypothetical protein
MMLAEEVSDEGALSKDGGVLRLYIAVQDLTAMVPPRTNLRSHHFGFKGHAKSLDNRSRAFVWLEDAHRVAAQHVKALQKQIGTPGQALEHSLTGLRWLEAVEPQLLTCWSSSRVKYTPTEWQRGKITQSQSQPGDKRKVTPVPQSPPLPPPPPPPAQGPVEVPKAEPLELVIEIPSKPCAVVKKEHHAVKSLDELLAILGE